MENELCGSFRLPWLRTDGKEGDVVLSSRVRLARNFDRMPFPCRGSRTQLAAVEGSVTAILPAMEEVLGRRLSHVRMEDLTSLEREMLCVKHLVSRKLIREPECRSLLVSEDQCVSVMVNEDDHLRITCMAPGLDLETPLGRALGLDDVISERIPMAFDEKLGYLTSWPTNLGTGLRISVIMHLPGLVYTENIDKIVQLSAQLGIQIRGMYSSGREVVGNLYRISNQLTLGFSETELVGNIRTAIMEIAAQERRARKALELHQPLILEDHVWRAYGALRYARRMHSGDALNLMSKLFMGVKMGMVDTVRSDFFPELLIVNREGYLKYITGDENLPKEEIYRLRADTIRQVLARHVTSIEGNL